MGFFKTQADKLEEGMDQTVKAGKHTFHKAKHAGNVAVDDLRDLLSDLENAISDKDNKDISILRNRVEKRLSEAKNTYLGSQAKIRERVNQALADTDGYVHDKPWESIGAVAGIAFLLGVLVGRS